MEKELGLSVKNKIKMIPIAQPYIGDEEIKAVSEVINSGIIAQGPKVSELEKKYAQFCGTNYAVAVNSGTAALHTALHVSGIKKGDEVVGGRVRVKVVKNKVAAPFKSTEFDLMYNEGISREGEIIALGEKYGIIDKSGASYSFGEEKLARGYDATRTYLKENKKVANQILKEIATHLKSD